MFMLQIAVKVMKILEGRVPCVQKHNSKWPAEIKLLECFSLVTGRTAILHWSST